MRNHADLPAHAKNENLSALLRDFKRGTSKQIIKATEQNEKESRKDWMLRIFREQGERNSRNKEYQFRR
jgi:putative transposase